MKEQDVMDYVEELKKYGSHPGLSSITALCEKLGNPQEELKFVHIAGTNGKGSVTAFLTEILKKAGYRVGRYISPTIFEYRERIQIGTRPISKKDLGRLMEQVREACLKLVAEGKPHPTAFEVETALGFLYFKEKRCELVVLETGMGGLLDATNIVKNTVVSVITSISYDHMAVLGRTLHQIAAQKAGIFKQGAEAVVLKADPEVLAVFEQKAGELSVPLRIVDPGKCKHVRSTLSKQSFDYEGMHKIVISMAGRYQIDNACLAIEAIRALRDAGYPVSEKALYEGLLCASWPGRFQVIGKKPCFIADGAHNRDGARRLAESLRFYFTNKRILYIIGILRDKEQDEILKNTCFLADQVLTVPTPGERGMSSYELACMVRDYQPAVTALDSVQEAVEMAYLLADKDTVVVAFGSLSYLGALIKEVEKAGKDHRNENRKSGV